MAPTSRSTRDRSAVGPPRGRILALAGLALLGLLAGCAGVSAQGAAPRVAVPLKYQSLYLGLDGGGLSQPALMARTSYAAIEKYFPEPQSASPTPRASAQGGQLYVGVTLGRLTCRNYYLARARYGPGLVVTLTVRQRRLPPRMACFELIGPVRYQLLALPLGQFPGHARLTVLVHRPPGASLEQVRLHLP